MPEPRPFLMSTHGPRSSKNAEVSLAQPFDLAPISDELDAAQLTDLRAAYVWAFKDRTPVMTNPVPLRAGDVAMTTSRLVAGGEVLVRRLFPVEAVFRRRPDLPGRLGIQWRGDGWDNVALLGEPIVLDPPVPFDEVDERFDVRPGAMFTAKFLRTSVSDLVDFLMGQSEPSETGLEVPDDAARSVTPKKTVGRATVRLNREYFRTQVALAYGTACAACDFDPGFYVGAHLKDFARGGPDEWWNGIPLCPNHHVLFDRGRIRIEPTSRKWVSGVSDSLEELRVSRAGINHLPNAPLGDFVRWKWSNPVVSG